MHTTCADSKPCDPRSSRRELEEAQRSRAYRIAGEPIARLPFGRELESLARDGARCSDCGAASGEYHVPGCENEECPACGGRVISCDCAYGSPSGGASMA